VRGASQLARAAGLSPLIIGLTVVSFGTSAPELATSTLAALRGQGDVAFGNVVGSNIFNVLVVLGASAVITPLVVAQKLVWFDVPLMIGLSVAVVALGWDGSVSRLEGLLLVMGLVAMVAYSVRSERNEAPEVIQEYEDEYGDRGPGRRRGLPYAVGVTLAGLTVLVLGSRLFVDGAVAAARVLGVSELVIGLTIVAAGTSLPELVTSIVAAMKKEQDIAVGNVVGSNVFNILGVLGIAALAAPSGVAVSEVALGVDVPVMIATAVACLPIFFTGHAVLRWEGLVLVGYYAAYLAFVVLDATRHDSLPLFSGFMLAFVLPLTVLTMIVVTVREVRSRRASQDRTV